MKIAISGAGVAGPTLAYWLMRAGHEPLLIERAPHLRTRGYIIDFWGLGYDLAERMGILPQVQEAGYAVETVRLVDGNGRTAGSFDTDVFRKALGNRFASLPRGDLAAAIYQALGSDVEALFATTITAIDEHSSGVRVALSNGDEREVDLVVGADGLHSSVRSIVFGSKQRFERPLGYHVAAFEAPGYAPRDERAYVSYAAPGRQISRFAERGGRTLFLFVFADTWVDGIAPANSDERKQMLARVFSCVGWEWPRIREMLEATDDIYFDRVSQIHMDSWSKGRVALVGDAAACVSLLAGEGAGLGMAEAYVLAHALVEADGDYRRAFAAYEARLRPLIERKQRSARGFARTFAPRTALGIWFRNHAASLLRFPKFAEMFVTGDLRDDFALPDWHSMQKE